MYRYIKKKFVTGGSNSTKSQLTAASAPGPPPPPPHLKLPYIMIFLIMANQSKKRNTPDFSFL